MSRKIIVAGAGHGGLTAAALLAKAGFDVTIYERNEEGKLGYDWTDIFDPKALDVVGCPRPEEVGLPWEWKIDMTFYGPNTTPDKKIRQRVPNDPNEMEIKMERSDIYKLLIDFAVNNGAKIEYGVKINGPVMAGDRVIGISTDKGDFLADMVIDAAGAESVIRTKLPDCLGIQKHPNWGEKFYVYRAFYDLPVDPATVDDKYKVILYPDSESIGIGWIATEDTFSDLLIGHMDPLSVSEAEEIADRYRKTNPQLGTKKLRGGQLVLIPVRQPLSIMVADGYAAIGDSAFMTVPIIGSGIGNAIKNSKILAETIINDKTETYSAETLWPYQYEYFQKMGKNIAPLALVKLLLTRISQDQLDYAFNEGILTHHELTITANHTSLWKFLHFDPNLPKRGVAIVKDPDLLKKGAGVVLDVVAALAVEQFLPKQYSRPAVQAWAKCYDTIFTHRLKAMGKA
ncbi:MAG: NAD(P)-binding protein [Clostridiales bacterium]|nr:NAD(P)-binding protein [Clostridia bacterium]MBQ1529262.1 NAD(P)-binding protein [Clostridia bacterium]MBQ5580662.1 NAD(P)-binding protein [Clostridia bacterium]MBQ5685834.1 NAD(P)-binding protein [Clostridia bacterium]NLD30406.1 NAD(P)-binding protein [Clostridiales bacterium]